MNRRRFLQASVVTMGVAGTGAMPVAASNTESLESWFENTDNYDGTVDMTGQETVRVEVGAAGNGGNFAFSPAAIRVDPGTTVVWEWVNGYHDVAATDGAFQSEMVGEAGHEFSHTFDTAGEYRYVCTPHEAMEMKGAVVVGDADSASGGSAGQGQSGSAATFLTGTLAGAVLTVLFALPFSELRQRSAKRDENRRARRGQ